MKKSLLLLSLLASANMFAEAGEVVQEEVVDVDPIHDAAAVRPAGETHEQFLQACGGQVPHVASHQTGEQRCLHVATRGKSVTKPTRTRRSQARRQTRNTQHQAVVQQARHN
jgi:hypothetical protein